MGKNMKEQQNDKQVQKRPEAEVPTSLLTQFDKEKGGGFENTSKDAYAVPFLKILQQMSPQVNEDDESSYVQGAKQGMFFNSVSAALYGKEVKVIPITYYREFIEWRPERGGFVRAHGADPAILDRTTRNEKNQDVLPNGNIIQDCRCHVVLVADDLVAGPMILGLVSTGIRHSKKWMSLMRMIKTPNNQDAPMYSSVWKLWTVLNKNDDGSWYMIGDGNAQAFERVGWVNEDQWHAALEAKALFDSGKARMDYEQMNEGRGGGSDSDSDDTPF